MLKLIVGLGNPGKQYKSTRHNLGFEVIDEFKASISAIACSSKFKAEVCEADKPHKFFILKPETFMNESGLPVGEFARFYKINPEEILVVYDDLDLPLGHLRLSEGGSAGGHRGVESVISNLGANFWRLRLGLGDNRAVGIPSEDYVLQQFKPEEREIIKKSISKSVEIIKLLLAGQNPKQQIAEHNKNL